MMHRGKMIATEQGNRASSSTGVKADSNGTRIMPPPAPSKPVTVPAHRPQTAKRMLIGMLTASFFVYSICAHARFMYKNSVSGSDTLFCNHIDQPARTMSVLMPEVLPTLAAFL